MPYVPTPSAVRQHPMHHHVFTFLTGDEQDITDLIPMVDDRPSQRQRTATEAAHMNQDNNRSFSIASWLDKEKETRYKTLALAALNAKGMGSGFELGKLKGSQIAGITDRHTGRQCAYGCSHESNSFFIDFERSGAIAYHCYGVDCRPRKAMTLGQWSEGLSSMLNNPEMWQPGSCVDATLLKNAQNCGRKATPKKEQMIDQDWYSELEETVCRYISNFWVFVSKPSVCVLQTLDSDGQVATYTRYDGNKLKNVVQPYEWAFQLWNKSHLRETMGTKVTLLVC